MALPNILFLCTGNSCRSQMAEGFARALLVGRANAYSAGTKPQQVNPNAVRVMNEIGIDLSDHRSKHFDELSAIPFKYVVTVCDDANESCPLWRGTGTRIHHPFDDPPRLASSASTEEEALGHYRRVRDEIKQFVEQLGEKL